MNTDVADSKLVESPPTLKSMAMLNDSLDRLAVVLVRARDPNNIGAVARAMHDFGFRHLRLVNEYSVPLERARSAVDASAVLESAREYTSVAEAIADCTLVVGTTAVGLRRQQHPLYTLAEAGNRLQSELTPLQQPNDEHPNDDQPYQKRLALLFGSEKTGLSNEELSHCHWLLTIPMHETPGMRHASMNLGQAVAVCLYELVRSYESVDSAEIIRDAPAQSPASQSFGETFDGAPVVELERLTALLTEVMEESEYNRRHPANFDELLVRRLVRQMNLDHSHTLAWTGILRQILWKLRSRE